MTVVNEGAAFRKAVLGNGPVSKASGTLSAATFQLFTVAGGEVMITGLWLKVTTAISTDGGTLALQIDPTTGDTSVVVTATDLGTTDSAVGTIVGVRDQGDGTTDFAKGQFALSGLVVPIGEVELVGAASVNGAVTAYATWIPLTDGATLVAAA